MPNLEKAFGIHEVALSLQARRTEVLASNLANADTPGFKARDIDFKAELQRHASGEGGQSGLRATHARHITAPGSGVGGQELYRNPMQPSIDGNTVETQIEKAAFMENALNYQSTLSFINGKIKTINKALKGS